MMVATVRILCCCYLTIISWVDCSKNLNLEWIMGDCYLNMAESNGLPHID